MKRTYLGIASLILALIVPSSVSADAQNGAVKFSLQMLPVQHASTGHVYIRFVVQNISREPIVLELPASALTAFYAPNGQQLPSHENCPLGLKTSTGRGGTDIDIVHGIDNRSYLAMWPQNRLIRPGATFSWGIDYGCKYKPTIAGNYKVDASFTLLTALGPRDRRTGNEPYRKYGAAEAIATFAWLR